ncbi:hypothetical protein OHB41_05745 [Streptomyces sp. NBC_01571]|uniref:hypothetical protein n=1 Tax=Streptomyces sp. NBC_01571 TaxID=2975883 RepID=UPI00224E1C64|nr:hypothetical protein [Streptomyces sp. NBC_01571]MCX4572690.1 hypothetical protein [Streptomyces sp. NBC_01571]
MPPELLVRIAGRVERDELEERRAKQLRETRAERDTFAAAGQVLERVSEHARRRAHLGCAARGSWWTGGDADPAPRRSWGAHAAASPRLWSHHRNV